MSFRLFDTWEQIDNRKMVMDDPLIALKHETDVNGPSDTPELQKLIAGSDACSGSGMAVRKVVMEKLQRVRDARAALVSHYEKHSRAADYVAKQSGQYSYTGCQPKEQSARDYIGEEAALGIPMETGSVNMLYLTFVVNGAKDFKTAYEEADQFLVAKMNMLNGYLSQLQLKGGLHCKSLQ
jgi:hypothetical protein